jgi:hypothetical protein
MTELIPNEVLPEDAASWLAYHGWERVRSRSNVAALWRLGDNEVLQPISSQTADYYRRWSDMLSSLSRFAAKSPEALVDEMLYEGADVCEWRASVGITDSTIALEDGHRLVNGARNAFIAAANATIHRRGYFGHHTTKAAREHARAVRMAQTRRGSYVIPIISRVPGATTTSEDERGRFDIQVSSQPFERRVMVQLAEALQAIQELAVGTRRPPPSMRILNERVANGVSHELCSAVADVLTTDSLGDLGVNFSWARRLPTRSDVRRVELPRSSAPIIKNMAEHLRGSEVVAEQTLYGYVRGHVHDRDEDTGDVTIRAAIGTRERLVRMTLDRTRLHQALMAADELRPVYVTGTLVRDPGRIWQFATVSEFGFAEFIPTD